MGPQFLNFGVFFDGLNFKTSNRGDVHVHSSSIEHLQGFLEIFLKMFFFNLEDPGTLREYTLVK